MSEHRNIVRYCGREQKLFAKELLVHLSPEAMRKLQEDFESKDIKITDFVDLMEDHLPECYFDEHFVHDLVNLFEEIDVNGDKTMQWEEFVGFIIESSSSFEAENISRQKYHHSVDYFLTDTLQTMFYFPENQQLYCCEEHTNNVIVVDPATGTHLRTLRGHTGAVTGVVHLPNLHLFITSSMDRTLCVWDEEEGKCIYFTLAAKNEVCFEKFHHF
ncbi:putative WD domain, G-beta repeat [Monocercomonoides exilis]|uniref:putative WD domain, G-beta repeat n=1 Tax=Monocercomonoides exilis TaxID=2049356 RepID=UPI00355AB46F|nr:putative WD domain, G-beta repeat [Monocercomonoides exilis]